MPSVFLITHSFPYGFVEPFLETEIIHLAKHLERVIIVPCRVYGKPRKVPENVLVDTSLGSHWPKSVARGVDSCVAAARTNLFYHEVITHSLALMHPDAFARLVAFVGDYRRFKDWAFDRLPSLLSSDSTNIVYTYWTGPLTLAAGTLKQQYPSLKVISRAHRIDLYENVHSSNYLPLRQETLAVVDRIFVVSEHGRHHLSNTHPETVVEVARLGVNDPGFTTRPSDDGVFRIASCSFMVPKKRLDLLLDAIIVLGLENPSLVIEWHHLGSGDLRVRLERRARTELPHNVHHVFHGQIPNSAVMEFYRTQPIDVFVNVSASEGIPVSIMEAQSCGIPIIATGVGGTPEIVDNRNGILLDANPGPEAVAQELVRIAKSDEEKRAKGTSSKRTWQLMYNAEVNYQAFADRLWTLFGT